MPRVYIVNRSAHDYSAASEYGDLFYITDRRVDRFNVNDMVRQAEEAFVLSESGDYILLTSLTILCSVCCSVFAAKHGRLNVLIFKDGRYIERKVVFEKERADVRTTGVHQGVREGEGEEAQRYADEEELE
jgi:hypothetical protein